ncbi:MAG TPA: helix-turn-helix domain-containing protein [Amaricoccus sp.]|uniref:helix-turn-helix transcriptional regulator n=1 Tax=Amaricoccus sp. TaxID=1872485 RepID=UPI002C9EEEB4|nr:helix-turn-helix domain-containing protein [Amaricoccus sp.]HMQ94294.1 helix-turn-helix domain-containing protein [Amaricoccus sp.]HMR54621.1 helix-turn-helix domain-containing protein [Amaricoccus sp.]HMU01671.1 helix-turn-helix domain-containing protein [Amaricoccus sp.]
MSHRIDTDDIGSPDRPHLVEDELAQRWRLSTRTLQRWRRDSTGPAYLRLGRRIVYRLSDIEAFEATHLDGRP